MKTSHYIPIIALSLLISSCGSSTYISNKKALSIEKGMTKKEVENILGAPDFKRFDGDVEELEFHRLIGSVVMNSSITIQVLFVNGIVESMNSFDPYIPAGPQPSVMISSGINDRNDYSDIPINIDINVMERDEFNKFFADFKNETFESDRVSMINHLSPNARLTCGQCRKIVDLYTFNFDRKEWIKRLAPRIADRGNLSNLLDTFTFDSDKKEMREYINSNR